MKAWVLMILALSVAQGALCQALAQTQEKAVAPSAPTAQQQRTQIQQLKADQETRFATEEAACQTRFAVTGCVTDVRRRRREVMADLNRQEGLLNSQERRAKGGDQLIRLEEKAGRSSDRLAAQATVASEPAASDAAGNPAEKASQSKTARTPKKPSVPLGPASSPVPKASDPASGAQYRLLQEKKYNEKLLAAEARRKKKAAELAARPVRKPQPLPTTP